MTKEKHQKSSVRLFVASALSSDAVTHLAALYGQTDKLEKRLNARITWVPKDNLHITWMFFGNIAVEDQESYQQRMDQLLSAEKRIVMHMGSLALWKGPRKSKLLVWLGNIDTRIERLHRHLEREFPLHAESRVFRPHVTLARLKSEENGFKPLDKMPNAWEPGAWSWHINQVGLYQSELHPTGAVYTCLKTWSL